jgi:hypothetical protein
MKKMKQGYKRYSTRIHIALLANKILNDFFKQQNYLDR